ncbi:Imm49 family immunity protein [Archangium sp.]|uniref:Imm49 family immunity protein n=1 Tax=Archangium sp. TaxID=1872627 RepID=UPI002D37959B|nr:Imm49 family immunity protein [Archangium sp.]HYO55247.1 Imm49 family immunity protein [Archangium sp.]
MTVASTFLPVFRKNALYENERLVPMVRTGKARASEVLELCRNYRVAGICSLLMSASASESHHFLRKSTAAFAWCTAQGTPAFTLVRVLAPLLDALCTGDIPTARDIARQVGSVWDSRSEYEEDFLYARFLCSHFLGLSEETPEASLVDRYAQLVGQGEDPRLLLVKSFLERDEALFGQGLEALLSERAARYQRLAAKEAIPLWESSTEGYVCVEGLALVALAERKGFKTRSDYLHVPSLARLPAPAEKGSADWEAEARQDMQQRSPGRRS